MIETLEIGLVLCLGEKGFLVTDLQKRLGIEETGTFDQQTFDSVRDFQIWYGLKPDGIVADEVWAKLQEVKK